MKQGIIGNFLRFVPKNLLSYFVGWLVQLKLPEKLSLLSVRYFAKYYKINLEEAESPVEQYKTIGDLFTRKLKPGLRPIGEGLVHPADAKLTQFGKIEVGHLIQAKGKTYSLSEFLGTFHDLTPYEGGSFLTYYLCPTDYHRVHSPVSGKIIRCTHIPGKLWPVNPWSVENISQLFSVNERVVTWIQSEDNLLAVVMVGATNVGKMTMSFDEDIVTNTLPAKKQREIKVYDPGIEISRGDELGIFNMGSTVVIVAPKSFDIDLPKEGEYPTRMGESFKDLVRS